MTFWRVCPGVVCGEITPLNTLIDFVSSRVTYKNKEIKQVSVRSSSMLGMLTAEGSRSSEIGVGAEQTAALTSVFLSRYILADHALRPKDVLVPSNVPITLGLFLFCMIRHKNL